jgi:hypothetical protein
MVRDGFGHDGTGRVSGAEKEYIVVCCGGHDFLASG